jgi:hypothetical protein
MAGLAFEVRQPLRPTIRRDCSTGSTLYDADKRLTPGQDNARLIGGPQAFYQGEYTGRDDEASKNRTCDFILIRASENDPE